MVLTDELTALKGIGPELAKKFALLGVRSVYDLIEYYPRRYDDFSQITSVADLRPGPCTIQAVLKQIKGRYVRRGMHITEAVMSDESGSVRIVWFNQPYRESAMKSGQQYYVSGMFELSHQRFAIMNPSTELVSDFPVNTARIVPIYKETKGLTSRQIRQALVQTLSLVKAMPETLPAWLLAENHLLSRADAYQQLHFPTSAHELSEAKRRLAFEEVFSVILASLLNKSDMQGEKAPAVPFSEAIAKQFVNSLPFKLTNAQRKVIWQIYLDMQRTQPMNRLVEGDVGSGKTVVAAMAAVMVLHDGHQVALMAPTELLARQHAETVQRLLEPLGYGDQVGLLVGSMTTAQKARARQSIAAGKIRFIIGTHALIQDQVDMHSLELIIIDEQHRFGVEQRKVLQKKAGHMPHVLHLTATPIPRSLALTLYGELDVSILDEKPEGRKAIETQIVAPTSRARLYKEIDLLLKNGRQMYVVCPLIAESEAIEATSAEQVLSSMTKAFMAHTVGLLHGKMKSEDKNKVMQDFIDHRLDILVSTTVIEVGVDVPNATIMIIESAERFGLAQLHQLRGRVGRGSEQSYCYLMLDDARQPSRRLRALERSQDGFKLAELDLELRGPGAIYGSMQHGQLDLRMAKLTDVQLLAKARQAAEKCLEAPDDLLQYKQLWARLNMLRAVTNLN